MLTSIITKQASEIFLKVQNLQTFLIKSNQFQSQTILTILDCRLMASGILELNCMNNANRTLGQLTAQLTFRHVRTQHTQGHMDGFT